MPKVAQKPCLVSYTKRLGNLLNAAQKFLLAARSVFDVSFQNVTLTKILYCQQKLIKEIFFKFNYKLLFFEIIFKKTFQS
jgi:hypothetical protein